MKAATALLLAVCLATVSATLPLSAAGAGLTPLVAWLVVAEAIVEALQGIKLEYPKITGAAFKELKAVEKELRAEAPPKVKQGKDA